MDNTIINEYKLKERKRELSFLKDRLNFAINAEIDNLKDLPRLKRLIQDAEEKITKDVYKECLEEIHELQGLIVLLKDKLKVTKKKLKYLKYGKCKTSTQTT